MGSLQTKEKSPSDAVVEGLKNKVHLLQCEIHEVMCIRERESEVYERELMAFAFKQAEWKRERKRLKDEIRSLRKVLEHSNNDHNHIISDEEQARRDQTLEKWKELYFAIKVELDDLIRRTREEERLCWKTEGDGDVMLEMKREVAAKGERIEFLEARLAAMERQEVKREREMDILRQSLRIMSHKKRSSAAAMAKHQRRSTIREL
ncbi:uncharacterized protein LOC125196501 [Salvia hispanica]|uniref:uncharacterized protein LOC125196501 n=1 Tax=Salvia hispanica TaxID=49212 RepID=UPI002009C9B3|nr:uncharacterized protein LOC125196501 [Salvia hispanica]